MLQRPGQVICGGMSYAAHNEELSDMMAYAEEIKGLPFFFVKAPRAYNTNNSPIVLPDIRPLIRKTYEHPHGHVRLETKGEGATAGKTWSVVLAPPSRMARRGLEKSALKPGINASVEGYPNRDKPEEMRAERITVNGKTIELR